MYPTKREEHLKHNRPTGANRYEVDVRGPVLLRNAAVNLLGHVVTLVVGVVTVPVTLRGLGVERFGVLSLGLVVLGYWVVFDVGLGRATTRFVADSLGRADSEKVGQIVWSAATAQMFLGCAGTVLLMLVAGPLVERFFSIPDRLVPEARQTFRVLALSLPVALMASSFRGVLEAVQRFDLVNAVKVPLNSAIFFVPLAGALLGWRLTLIAGVLVLCWTLGLFSYYFCCATIFPTLRLGRVAVQASLVRSLIAFGGWVTVSNAVSPILVYLDRFVIGAVLGVAAVTYYSVPYDIITRFSGVPAAVVAALFPAFSTLASQGFVERLNLLASRSTKYLLLILGAAIGLVVALASDILQLWLGAEFAGRSSLVLQILGIGVLVNALAFVPFSMVQGLGRPDLTARFHLLELPFYIPALWFAVRLWGIGGASVAWLLRVAVDSLLLFAAAARLSPGLGRELRASKLLELSALIVAFATVTVWLSRELALPAVRILIILCFYLALVVIAFWRFLDREERAWILRWLQTRPAS